jgi:hypothetical protein
MFSNNDNRTNIRNLVYPLACISLLLTSVILAPSIIPSGFSKLADDKDESKSGKKNKPTHSGEGKNFSNKDDDKSKKSTRDEDQETGDEPSDEDKQPSEASAPIIITNTVTTPTSDIDKDKDEDEDEDENEGPTRFGFVDSYFTDQAPSASLVAEASSDVSNAQDIPPVRKQEVGPGEGGSTLVVILINRGFSDVTSIRATLDFPSGFKALLTPKNIDSDTAISTYNGIVNAGKTFPLYFPVNVTDNTQVGKEYTGSLNIKYFNVAEKDEEDTRDRTFKIPFKLSGKVILDAIWFSSSSSLLQSGYHPFQDTNSNVSNVLGVVPNEPNILKTRIKNEGSAPATGVIVNIVGRNQQEDLDNNNVIPTTSNNGNISTTTIQQSTVTPLITAGTTSFNLGTIPSGGSMQINPVILPSISVGSILENIDLQISYNDAYGNRKTLTKLLGVQILPSSPESGLSMSSDVPTSSTIRDMTLTSNATMNKREAESFSNGNNGYRNNNNYTYPLTQVSDLYYNDKAELISNKLDNKTGDGVSTLRNDSSTHLVGGKVDDLTFNITNSNNSPITDAVVSLDSDTSSIKILGDSKWNLDKIDSHTTQQFLTKVFASKSLINSPVSFRISIEYIYNNQAKSDSFNLGANIVGDITVTVNDLAVNYIGGTPNLVGDLLNKGNTLALFTTIQLVEAPTVRDQLQEESPSSISNGPKNKMVLSPATSFPQYLGDLEENSPLPFSIPLSMDNNTALGIYPVSLKITYSDDLRNSYTVFNNGTVEFIPPTPTSNQGQGFLGFNNVILTMVIAIIVGIFAIIIVRSRSKKRSKRRSNEAEQQQEDDIDIESLLDSQDSTDKEHIQKK